MAAESDAPPDKKASPVPRSPSAQESSLSTAPSSSPPAVSPHRSPPARSSHGTPGKDVAEDSIHAFGVSPPSRPPVQSDAAPDAVASASRRDPSSSSARISSGRHPLPSPPSDRVSPAAIPVAMQRPQHPLSSNAPAIGLSGHRGKMGTADREGRDDTDTSSLSNPPASNASLASSSGVASRPPIKALEDEIVVSTTTNGTHRSPMHVVSEPEGDTMMEDVKDVQSVKDHEDRQDRSSEPPYPKRKRSAIYNELDEEIERSVRAGPGRPPRVAPQSPGPVPLVAQKSIVLGYWRDSTVPDAKDRHAVIGFIDTRERLRTRIQQNSRTGERIPPEFPLPPGPGGSWVTFERVVFEKHLVGLDHNQVKEYVKLRVDPAVASESPEEVRFNEKAAVKEAMRRAALHPPADNLPPPQIAYGEDLPDYVVNANRPEKKRRMGSTGSNYGGLPLASSEVVPSNASNPQQLSNGNLLPAGSPSVASAIQQSAIDLLPGTRPTKILLGYWRGSSEERLEDKHAVFGILGANDMFRVKVTRETRDGRPVFGNFPTGAGALWIHYDEVEFEKHIRHLSRPEVKEYVRVRQRQLDEGETPAQTFENESKAVYEAQARVISAGGGAQSTLGTAGRVDTISFASAANLNREMNRHVENRSIEPARPEMYAPQDGRARREYAGHELRQTRRTMDAHETSASLAAAAVAAAAGPSVTRSGRHSLPDGVGMSASRHPLTGHGPPEAGPHQNADRVERTNSLARREVARVENIQMRNEQRAASREAAVGGSGAGSGSASGVNSPGSGARAVLPSQHSNGHLANGANPSTGGTSSRQAFSENIGRLNKVWAAQEASRLRADGEDAKIFMGVKYERKQTGPFQGKLVSPGTILSIDGEDYVEYRVLTKPTFF